MEDKNKRKSAVVVLIIAAIFISVLPRMQDTGTRKTEIEGGGAQEYNNSDLENDNGNSITNNSGGEEVKEYRGLIIVNKDNPLPKGYRPDDLRNVNIPFNHPDGSEMNMMRDEAAEHLEDMVKGAENDGIQLIGVSGFRSYDYQQMLYEDEVKRNGTSSADKLVARPGYSEHNTGLAVDLFSGDHPYLDEDFENTKAFKWLCANCSQYGFILRYPKDKESITGYAYEPWHFRYTGSEIADEIMERKITLEEYITEN